MSDTVTKLAVRVPLRKEIPPKSAIPPPLRAKITGPNLAYMYECFRNHRCRITAFSFFKAVLVRSAGRNVVATFALSHARLDADLEGGSPACRALFEPSSRPPGLDPHRLGGGSVSLPD